MRRTAAALAAALCVVTLVACNDDDSTFTGTRLDPPFEVLATPLTDTDGQPYSLVDDTDKPLTLVFFGYTNCPDICGVVMSNLGSAMTRLDASDRDRVDVVFVTTDPNRDTAPVLEKYVTRFDPSFLGLTGDIDTISAVAMPLGVGVEQGQKLPSGGYDVTHGTSVTAIDGDDEGTVYWDEATSSAQYAADIHTLLNED